MTWGSRPSDGTYGDYRPFLGGRRYDASGQALGREFAAFRHPASDFVVLRTEAEALPSGRFVIAWKYAFDTTYFDTRAAVFEPEGGLLTEISFGQATDPSPLPRLSAGPDSTFVVSSLGYDAGFEHYREILNVFDNDGTPLFENFLVSEFPESSSFPHGPVEHLGDGRFLVLWASDTSPGDDSSNRSVQVRRIKREFLFADGFESGDTSAWANAVP